MRKAEVLYKEERAGVLTQFDDGSFSFQYDQSWNRDPLSASISLTLPKREEEFLSTHLFPFFFNMLPEGTNKQVVCKYNRIDLDDYFGLLMITASDDSIGAVSVQKINN